MKNKLPKLILCILFVLIWNSAYSQLNRSYILKNTNQEALANLANVYRQQYLQDSIEKMQAALLNGWPTVNLFKRSENGSPIYEEPTNNEAATIMGTTTARIELSNTGADLEVGMWEAVEPNAGFSPRSSHQDFELLIDGSSRISINDVDDPSVFSSHATHVAGTLIGSPPSSSSINSRGMAYSATLQSYSSADDLAEMTSAASQGMLVSNHSYSNVAGWDFDGSYQEEVFPFIYATINQWTWMGAGGFQGGGDDPQYGAYSFHARSVDEISYYAPYYISVWATGNEHTDNPWEGTDQFDPPDEVRNGVNGTYVDYDTQFHPVGDGMQPTTVDRASSMNSIVVGNVTKNYEIANSSSRGILDDGRLALDLCGIGTDVYSAWNSADNAYESITGTSMATPTVAGSILILQEGYEQLHGSYGKYLKGATVKALVNHAAEDLGLPGPDETFGWGLMDTEKCAEIIQDDAWTSASSHHLIIESEFTTPGQTMTFPVKVQGGDQLRVTMAYYDPIHPFSLMDPLQNDLDLRVVAPSGTVLFPLAYNNNGTADDDVDNIEMVKLSSTSSSIYEIKVSLENSALYDGNPQPFSLIVSGLDPSCHYNINHEVGIELSSGTYGAQTTINSAAIIKSGENVTYNGGGSIFLNPGFRTEGNSKFIAENGTCN